jgi:hypothetical protein
MHSTIDAQLPQNYHKKFPSKKLAQHRKTLFIKIVLQQENVKFCIQLQQK